VLCTAAVATAAVAVLSWNRSITKRKSKGQGRRMKKGIGTQHLMIETPETPDGRDKGKCVATEGNASAALQTRSARTREKASGNIKGGRGRELGGGADTREWWVWDLYWGV